MANRSGVHGLSTNPLAVTYVAFTTVVPLSSLFFAPAASTAMTWMSLCLAVAYGALVAFEWRRAGHPLTPVGILALGGLLIGVLRPLTLLSSGTTTAGARADSQVFDGPMVEAGALAMAQWVMFSATLGLTYFARLSGGTSRVNRRRRPAGRIAAPNVQQASILLAAAAGAAILAAWLLIESSGGVAAHFSGLSNRSSFLVGRFFLTLGYLPLAVALVVRVLAGQRVEPMRAWTPLTVACGILLPALALLSGGRAPLVLGAILPLILLKQYGPKPLGSTAIVTLGLALVATALSMSLMLRDNVFDQGASLQSLREQPVPTLLDRLTSGAESRSFDSLVLLNSENLQGHVTRQFGRTYAAVPSFFLPSRILPDKQGGANAYFTRTFLPRFYYPAKVETSISAIGEAFLNFGWLGIAVVGSLVGAAAARFVQALHADRLRDTALIILLSPFFFSFMRGDSYQNLPLVLVTWVMVAVCCRLVEPGLSTGVPRMASYQRPGHGRVPAFESRRPGEPRP